MEKSGGGALFPVFLFDGERETDIGTVFLHPLLKYQDLKLSLSQQIGISPHQIAIFLADRKKYRSWPRKVAITAKFDFAGIPRGDESYLLVVLKRSRRDRRKKSRGGGGGCLEGLEEERVKAKKSPPENVILLRREEDQRMMGGGFYAPIIDRVGYEERVRQLQIERERYLMSMARYGELRQQREGDLRGDMGMGRKQVVDYLVCEECEKEKETGCGVGFHCCVKDPVTFEFRSVAGPISSPLKGPRTP